MSEWYEDNDGPEEPGIESEEPLLPKEPESVQVIEQPASLEQPSFEQVRKAYFARLNKSWSNVSSLVVGAAETSIMGKTLAEWHEFFHIKIPGNPAMGDLYELLAKTNSLISTINHNLGMSQLTRDAIEREVKSLKSSKFVDIKKSSKGKAPSNDMTNMQVEASIVDHLDQLMISEYIVTFWDNKRQALISTRKTLESMLFALTGEMKIKHNTPTS